MNEIMARIYWRSIQRGTRGIEDVPEELREAVLDLDRQAGGEEDAG